MASSTAHQCIRDTIGFTGALWAPPDRNTGPPCGACCSGRRVRLRAVPRRSARCRHPARTRAGYYVWHANDFRVTSRWSGWGAGVL